jgi:lipopolysaccharide transport system ATP-binding protein
MSQREIVTVNNLSKAYSIYSRPLDLLKETLTGRNCHDTFWALRDINFKMLQKERIGIIGANGSGKSTLLKIITGHLSPTIGSVKIDGNISAMLSLNTVLNLDETGLENIRFNLILNGCPKGQLGIKTEEIIEFTELGPFIYAPVKTYSSGMNAKLAFAITTAIEPDILVIDEVLSVGDAYFMGKATRRMKELCDRGNGLLFVSHSTSAVQMLCDKVLWMENGSVRMFGEASYIIKCYEEDYRRQEDQITRLGNASRTANLATTASVDDLLIPGAIRLRLVGCNDRSVLADTHYINKILVKYPSGLVENVALELPSSLEKSGNRLDVVFSEWGRIYEHDKRECRLLSPKTGKRGGGHILLETPVSEVFAEEISVEIVSCSLGKYEDLVLESINLDTGMWERCKVVEKRKSAGIWEVTQFAVPVPNMKEIDISGLITKVEALTKPSITISGVVIIVAGNEVTALIERQPFLMRVRLISNEPLKGVDIGIKIMRSDGVYVFWQSSGLVGHEIANVDGVLEVDFIFSENVLGPGDYALTAYVANQWDFPGNYPYSEIYDRKVGCLQFKIMPEVPGLDMGLINQRVEVRTSKKNNGN